MQLCVENKKLFESFKSINLKSSPLPTTLKMSTPQKFLGKSFSSLMPLHYIRIHNVPQWEGDVTKIE